VERDHVPPAKAESLFCCSLRRGGNETSSNDVRSFHNQQRLQEHHLGCCRGCTLPPGEDIVATQDDESTHAATRSTTLPACRPSSTARRRRSRRSRTSSKGCCIFDQKMLRSLSPCSRERILALHPAASVGYPLRQSRHSAPTPTIPPMRGPSYMQIMNGWSWQLGFILDKAVMHLPNTPKALLALLVALPSVLGHTSGSTGKDSTFARLVRETDFGYNQSTASSRRTRFKPVPA
jgi:hypothetical protein